MIPAIRLKNHNFEEDLFGVSCRFIQLSPRIGLKLYLTKKEAKFAFLGQEKAYKKGLAPKLYSGVDRYVVRGIDEREGHEDNRILYRSEFGFKTQIANPVLDYSLCDEYGNYSRKYENFLSKVYEANIPDQDLHDDNLGLINNKIVIIDFCSVSMS